MGTEPTTGETKEGGSFRSELGEGRQRFLAHVIQHALSVGRRSPDDFIRHFPPGRIMESLRDRAELRANILIITTGVKRRIALKKDAVSAGEDLQIALDEGETDPETIVDLFDPDHRVRYLDAKDLWRFIVEGAFWKAKGDAESQRIAKAHIAYMLDRALEDDLITHRDIVTVTTVEKLAQLLPREELAKLLAGALELARAGAPFSEEELIARTPPSVLVEHVPLTLLWEDLIDPMIAEVHGFADPPSGAAEVETATDIDVSATADRDDAEDEAPSPAPPPLTAAGGPPPLTPGKPSGVPPLPKAGAPKRGAIEVDVELDAEDDTQRGRIPATAK